jgi:hypothetical protein
MIAVDQTIDETPAYYFYTSVKFHFRGIPDTVIKQNISPYIHLETADCLNSLGMPKFARGHQFSSNTSGSQTNLSRIQTRGSCKEQRGVCVDALHVNELLWRLERVAEAQEQVVALLVQRYKFWHLRSCCSSSPTMLFLDRNHVFLSENHRTKQARAGSPKLCTGRHL